MKQSSKNQNELLIIVGKESNERYKVGAGHGLVVIRGKVETARILSL